MNVSPQHVQELTHVVNGTSHQRLVTALNQELIVQDIPIETIAISINAQILTPDVNGL